MTHLSPTPDMSQMCPMFVPAGHVRPVPPSVRSTRPDPTYIYLWYRL